MAIITVRMRIVRRPRDGRSAGGAWSGIGAVGAAIVSFWEVLVVRAATSFVDRACLGDGPGD